ncbi:hypothetical protein M885DRAFT_83508 [Pelagophyceae sp. CCMP2097]|nr:hypothetical protein M885DRAFT_83508 [Pelagophyceae sp. CCMP2097]
MYSRALVENGSRTVRRMRAGWPEDAPPLSNAASSCSLALDAALSLDVRPVLVGGSRRSAEKGSTGRDSAPPAGPPRRFSRTAGRCVRRRASTPAPGRSCRSARTTVGGGSGGGSSRRQSAPTRSRARPWAVRSRARRTCTPRRRSSRWRRSGRSASTASSRKCRPRRRRSKSSAACRRPAHGPRPRQRKSPASLTRPLRARAPA